MKQTVERLELTRTQQQAALALLVRRAQILDEANKVLAEIADALAELAQIYAERAGQDGEWEFGQDAPGGELYLRRKQADLPAAAGDVSD